ncbi:LysR family transcriptional regulator (plasmid) [Ketogulonicigenium robustum]|uniref:LysR family transcriptional regulator n=1 Tax=Ketogulonicigenium robustum TaxID=92947 RepID=A0A1W6P2Y6_9RHOB|nr:LysR substrate-binding domain-containing protein [Ketogulonicigenium robustum]ARO15846.1 LysR family transcriptional regulator [Ketogulonicigenium robustum]
MNHQIDLRHIRYFAVLAEELHFGRAAERLNMAQAPLSQQIRQLEERIGTSLFHRTTRHVQLSAAGHRFASYAQRILSDVDEAIRFTRATTSEEAGRIRVGCINMVMATILPGAIKQLKQLHPATIVTPVTHTTGVQIQMLLDDQLDLALTRPTSLPNYLHGEVIFQESFCVALPADHPLTALTTLEAHHLDNVQLMNFTAKLGTGYGREIHRALKRAGVKPVIGAEFIDTSSALCLVSASEGVAILPRSAAWLSQPGVVFRPINLPGATADIMLVSRNVAMDVKTRDLAGLIRQIARALPV